MSDPAFPADGTVVRLNTHTRRVRSRPGDDGGVLVGGAPIRVSRISSAAAERLTDRDLPVRDATSRALARYLLTTGMGELVASSLPAVPLSLLTVVVPVRDRPAQLARLLASVPAGVAEIVVVDDGSVRPAAVARVTTEHGARLLALPVNRGPGAARNAGLAETQTPYVAFVDSDVVLDERALDTMLRHMADPEVALVAPGVRGLRRERESWLERYEDARSSLDLGPDASTVRPRSRVSWVSSTCLVGRVAALGDGFDARLRVGEDVDLVWRLVADRHRVTYDPSALVRHEHRATLGAWMRRKFDYGTGAYGLGVRHPRDIAPVALPPWSIGLLAVTLAQRRWSIPVGVGIVAAFARANRGEDLTHPATASARRSPRSAGHRHDARPRHGPVGAALVAAHAGPRAGLTTHPSRRRCRRAGGRRDRVHPVAAAARSDPVHRGTAARRRRLRRRCLVVGTPGTLDRRAPTEGRARR
jgi:mycofactocin system glycosyltransferase